MLKKRRWAFVVTVLILPFAVILDVFVIWYALIFLLIGLWPILQPTRRLQRMPLLKKIISVIICLLLVAVSVAAWAAIDIEFDGCCGAPINQSNDTMQVLSHLVAFGVAATLVVFLIKWGWGSSKKG